MPERIDLSVDNYIIQNKRWRITKGQSTIDIPEKLATQVIQDENKSKKNTTQYVFDTTMRKQTQIM
jgi:hypothetical protein